MIQFVQGAIRARPALTEQIVTAALKLSPERAHRILLAAIRANPQAKAGILRIARNAGASGIRIALSLVVALFLYDLFGQENAAHAHENDEAYARRLSIPESFIGWLTSAAATMAVLFDDEAVGRLKKVLDLGADEDTPEFEEVVDRLTEPKDAGASSLDDSLGPDHDSSRHEVETAPRGSGPAGGTNRFQIDPLDESTGDTGGGAIGEDGAPTGGTRRLSKVGFDAAAPGRLLVLPPLEDEDDEDSDGAPDDAFLDETGDDPGPRDEPADSGAPKVEGDARITWSLDGDHFVGEGQSAQYSISALRDDPDSGGPVSVRIRLDLPGGADGAEDDDLATSILNAIRGAIEALGPEPGIRLDGDVLTFDAGGPPRLEFAVELTADTVVERPEGFTLMLDEPGIGRIVPGKGSVTTVIDDTSTENLRWSITGDLLVREGGAPRYTVAFAGVTLAEGVAIAIELTINLPGGLGGAEAADFTRRFYDEVDRAIAELGPDSGVTLDGSTLIFADGAPTSLTFALDTFDDDVFEDAGAENFTVLISTPSDGEIEAGRNLITTAILDNDPPIRISESSGGDLLLGTQVASATIPSADDGGAILAGGNGDDVIAGGPDGELLMGGNGDDRLDGGAGPDRIEGGRGDDTLIGGAGADWLAGGPGADVFVVSAIDVGPGGPDTIADFAASEGDSIRILDLIGGLPETMIDLDAFIRFHHTEGATVVRTDADGAAGQAPFVDTLVIQNLTGPDLDMMIEEGALTFA